MALPSAATVLRRGLLVWGLGHISIGDRRGWLLMALQPLAIVVWLFFAYQLIDGTRWLVVFPPLALLLVFWVLQAVHAYRLAVEKGAQPGGELQAAGFLAAAVVVLTVFWLVGGRHGSPTATLEEYVVAWINGRSHAAVQLYAAPPSIDSLEADWTRQSAYLGRRVTDLHARFGSSSGLDPAAPRSSLRFLDPLVSGTTATVEVDIVRNQRVETTILGIVPTAGQQMVVVERAGTIRLVLIDGTTPSWRITEVNFGG